jgi:GT2 family glycosyltransferase
MRETPWVRVVVVNFNGAPWLQRTVDALAAQTWRDFEAVIVDNRSTDGSIETLVLPDDRFRLIRADENLGFAAGCNLGAHGALAPWVAMLNPDAVAEPDWLEALRQAADLHPEAVAFGSTQLMAEGSGKVDGAGDNYSIFGLAWRGGFGSARLPTRDARVLSPCAAAALYRRDAFEAAGGFEPGFFCFLEDVDLGFRLQLAGGVVIQAAAPTVHHVGSALTGRHSRFSVWHGARNGVWLMARCLPAPLLFAALPLHLVAILALALVKPNCAAARLSGLAAGLRGLPGAWRQGRAIQRRRRVAVAEVAMWLAWNPLHLLRRDVVVLPMPSI